ncbi:hypothetical protein S7711_10428 [Stachybotrys chartarum IBT 7711]|uniref:Uncharacterized protein n=1 Tax=Stachybotrys chartarum (strain CBS 109288 / IBT 7711) TaxID=1280523 RepID=A0A084ASZ7_STACB|nr:hypothetical protein S7711_10428 [Stachybotrys chartarum IBT 7711]KFA48595.1 hypothetical protein S40293_10391 [Stachybotrys chartarum IBT 40293]KFA71856.1 hypothetical protein S40288_11301 [Stachybotrys chartarum IBT 40288]
MLSTILILTTLALLVNTLLSWSANPSADIAERNVMATSAYSLTGGAAVNLVCAAIVRAVGAVAPGDEMGACSPYGLIGAGVSARLHLFWLSGYTHGEWAYIAASPSRTLRSLDRGVEAARDYVGDELKRLGLVGGVDKVVDKSEL